LPVSLVAFQTHDVGGPLDVLLNSTVSGALPAVTLVVNDATGTSVKLTQQVPDVE
jgi:hypothetical protein